MKFFIFINCFLFIVLSISFLLNFMDILRKIKKEKYSNNYIENVIKCAFCIVIILLSNATVKALLI